MWKNNDATESNRVFHTSSEETGLSNSKMWKSNFNIEINLISDYYMHFMHLSNQNYYDLNIKHKTIKPLEDNIRENQMAKGLVKTFYI